MDSRNLLEGMGGILGGLFGDSGSPYDKAMDQYREWGDRAQGMQQPFWEAGRGAIGDYKNWLGGMQDPSGFINRMMGQYQESPWAKYQQDQARRGGINAASAGGLIGSTPYLQAAEEMAGNISSQDMQNWLQNVLGINTQYGQGQQNIMGMGANAANSLTNLFSNMGGRMGEGAYGREAGRQQDFGNMVGGGLQIASMFL